MEKNKILAGTIIIICILLMSVFVVTQTGFFIAQGSADTIKIGVIGGFTGIGAYYAQQEQRGVELAVHEINAQGGINGKAIQLIFEDSEINNVKAVTVIKKLIYADGVNYVIGDSWNASTAAMVPIATENKVILISGVTILSDLSKDDYFFRTVSSVEEQMKELANYAYNKIGSRRVAILSTDQSYSIEHAQKFKEFFTLLGGEIVDEESFPITQQDLKTELLRVKQKNPDLILNLHASGNPLGMLAKQIKESGFDVQIISNASTENAALLKSFKESIEGTIYPYSFDETNNQKNVQKFISLYKEKYGEIPDYVSANSYDAMMILAKAINQVGDNPEKVKEYLISLKNYEGGSGTISFDENGDVVREVIIKQVVNGEFVKIK